jgi:hypothetical protein
VVFTSGIVDEGPFSGSWPPQYYPSSLLVGVEPGGCGGGGVVMAHCWALRDQARIAPVTGRCGGWFFWCPLCPGRPWWGGWGVGGLAPCDLNSGREHLVADLHQDPSQIATCLVVVPARS